MKMTRELTALLMAVLVAGATARDVLGFTSKSGGFSSSVKCSAKADATSISAAKDAYVSAVAAAIAAGCSSDFGGSLEDIQAKFSDDWAYAFAAAVTNAESKCVSSGHAFGCSGAAAAAQAYAQATGQAHADAVAAAINKCQCTNSAAISFGSTDTYVQLIAQACSAVGSAVCVSGDSAASASSYQTCLGASSAHLFAKAVADALIQGGCMNTSAQTNIEAETGADFSITEGCEGTQTASGPPGSTSTGASGSGSANIFDKIPPMNFGG